MRAQHEAIEIVAQRGAAVAGERRAHPAGLRRVPRRLQIALRRGPRPRASTPPSRCRAASPARRPSGRGSADRRPAARCRAAAARRDRARSPTSRARVRAPRPPARRRRRAPTRTRSAAAPDDPSKYSVSPSPTMNSMRSRGVEPLADRAGAAARARWSRSSDAALSRNRSRYARAAIRSALSARAGVSRASLGGVHRRFELALVVEQARARRAGRGRRPPQRRSRRDQHEQHASTARPHHPAMVAHAQISL